MKPLLNPRCNDESGVITDYRSQLLNPTSIHENCLFRRCTYLVSNKPQ
ncbi:hypothetical protein EG68_01433 [Paragonimus skrjabini miyazakii]|uniref:Uncharacterized protein n=1 Tax=Paragonimus skrjabini miyazakii TaxID=59628 RepID=A0A8S9ZBW3_9TREM|nr:hypothetical protein EG68_01433 [Paragonimus skrjabini miyazakii]